MQQKLVILIVQFLRCLKILPAIEQHRASVEEISHPLLGSASMIITTINGGTAPNIVPQHCDIEIDRRLVPGKKNKK